MPIKIVDNGHAATLKCLAPIVSDVNTLSTLPTVLIDLLNKANHDGKLHIALVNPNDVPTGADYCCELRRIRLASTLPPSELFSALLIELCNAVNPAFQTDNSAHIHQKDYNDRDSYAHALECAEYNSVVQSYSIIKQICTNPDFIELFKQHQIDMTPHESDEELS